MYFSKINFKTHYKTHLLNDEVNIKKYFYALRPLLAGKYIQAFGCPPPVLFDELLSLPLSDDLRAGIDHLLAAKKVTEEKDLNPQIPVIFDFISSELALQKALADEMADDHNHDWEPLNRVFRDVVKAV